MLEWVFNTTNMFTLSKTLSCEIGFSYNSKSLDGEYIVEPVYTLEAGVKMNFANNRGAVTLNCSDILWSYHSNGSEIFQGENFTSYEYSDTRRLRISLSWRLGKTQQEHQQKDKASEEETNRIK